MHRVVFDEPYEFIPPYRGTFWSTAFQLYLPRHLKKADGLTSWDCRGAERLKASLAAGHGVLLCPNHCRPSDPMAMGIVNRAARCHSYSLASWHVFKQNRLQSYVTRRLGGFSIYREGMDRQALNTAIEIVANAERPLIVYPEGVISRSNNRLLSLMDGVAFIARSAAKKRVKQQPDRKVVIHPVALRYVFKGDVRATVTPVLTSIEQRLSWRPRDGDDIFYRIRRIGRALVGLKEIEHFGRVRSGSIYDRLEYLVDSILTGIEDKWLGGPADGPVVQRVKKIRSAIIPNMVTEELSESERDSRWRDLTSAYYAQQMSHYPRDYVSSDSPPEHVLETVERFEEDLTDKVQVHSPMHLILEIGEPIEVPTKRPRDEEQQVMFRLRQALTSMLAALGDEVAAGRASSS